MSDEELNICLLQKGVVIYTCKKKKHEENCKGSALGQQKISDTFCTFSAFTCLFLAGEKNVNPFEADTGKIWPPISLKKNKVTPEKK